MQEEELKYKMLKSKLIPGEMPYYTIEFKFKNEKKILFVDIAAWKDDNVKQEMIKRIKKRWHSITSEN